MEINITISNKLVKMAASEVVSSLLMDYTDEEVALSGIKEAQLIKEVAEDAKFLKALSKNISDSIDDNLIIDCAYDVQSPVIAAAESKLYAAQKKADAKTLADRAAQRQADAEAKIADSIKQLEKLGYKVTKK